MKLTDELVKQIEVDVKAKVYRQMKFTPPHIDKDDIVQEVFIKIIKMAESFDETKGSWRTFVNNVAYYEIITQQKRMFTNKNTSTDSIYAEQYDDVLLSDIIADKNSMYSFEYTELRMTAIAFLKKLNGTRKLVLQKILDGCSRSDISEQIQISHTRVHQIIEEIQLKYWATQY